MLRGCGDRGMFLHCWWECKLIQPLWKTVWRFLKKQGIKPPYDPAIPLLGIPRSIQFSSVTQLYPTLCDPMDCRTPGLPVHHQFPESNSTESVRLFNHFIICHPLHLLSSIFPSIRVFSNESFLRIRKPKHWSFSFSISPSNEYSGLISFRMD